MKNRLLSLMLALALCVTAVPFALAGGTGPVIDYGNAAVGPDLNHLTRFLYLTWAEGYTGPTAQCEMTLVYEDYDEPDGNERLKRYRLPDSALQTDLVPYYENGKAETRLQCYLLFDSPGNVQSVEVAAGSFAHRDGFESPAVTLGNPNLHSPDAPFTRFSKVMQAQEPLNSSIGVGVGDEIVLNDVLPLPVTIKLDGETAAQLPANYPAGTSFTAAEGTHTLELYALGQRWTTQSYTGVPQTQVYKNQLKDIAGEAGLLLLGPLAAPLAMIIAPPAGIAAALSPVFAIQAIPAVLKAVFRVFNLLKH